MSYKSLLDDCGFKNIPNGWDVYNLDDICYGIIDCPHSTPKLVENSSYYVAKTQDIRSGHFNSMDADCVSESTYLDRIKRAEPEQGDILFSREGTYFGDAAEVPANTKVCLGQRMVLIRPRKDIVDPSFLRLFINSKGFQKYLSRFHEGTVAQRINVSDIRKLPVLLPDRDTQEFIKSKIIPIEQKARLNMQTYQTLEQMAEAIFKSWFVDFDPVKAKMNGEQPEGMDAATASLFPEKLVESELGLIPEGWDVGELTELAKLDTTSVKPNKEPETIWEHYSIPAFDDGYYPSFDTGESIKSNKYKVKANAVLVSKLNPRFQRIWLPLPMDAEQAICSTEFMQFVPNVPALKPYLYSLVKSTPFQNELMNTVTGTTGSRQRAQPKQVAKAQVVVPPSQLMELYSEKVGAMFTMTQQNIRQNIELAKLRDTLLPKLLSGEIELRATEVMEPQS